MGTNYTNQAGNVSQCLIDYHVAKAKGGFRFITVEAAAVAPSGKTTANQLGLWSDEHIGGLKNLVDDCHKYGAKVSVQLHYAGRETSALIAGIQAVSSASISCSKRLEIPHELTTARVYEIIQKFADAAKRCRDAGADAIELHAAYGYLFDQILPPRRNKRLDQICDHGENRLNFLLLLIQRIRQQVDNAYPIIVRTGDLSIVEIAVMARRLENTGVNAILVSARPGYLAYLAEKIKKSVKIPVIIKLLLLPLTDTLNLMSQRIFCRLARRIC